MTVVTVTQWVATDVGVCPDWLPLKAMAEGAGGLQCVAAMIPGAMVFRGEPVLQIAGTTETGAFSVADAVERYLRDALLCERVTVPRLVQVYRRIDAAGHIVGDVLRWMDADPIPGMVMVRMVQREGRWCGHEHADLPAATAFEMQQKAALSCGCSNLPVQDDREDWP